MTSIPSDKVETLLDVWPVARLAIVDEAGRPQQIPIVFVRKSSRLWSPVDGKPKRNNQLSRLEHIRIHPEVGLLLDYYEEDWKRLWWIRVRATASVVPLEDRPEFRKELEVSLLEKYPQYECTEAFLGTPKVIELAITRCTSWCANLREFQSYMDRVLQTPRQVTH